MLGAIKFLPDDRAELRALSELLRAEVQSLTYQNEKLKLELYGHRKARSGSEGLDQLAFHLGGDQEIEAAAEVQHAGQDSGDEGDGAAAKPPRTRRKHNRAPLPEHLDRQDEVLSPGEGCTDCGGALRQIGEDVTEEQKYISGRFVVRRIVRPRMACTCYEAFRQASLPSRLIERGRPGPGLLAHVLVGKYRQSEAISLRRKLQASLAQAGISFNALSQARFRGEL